jgi:zinc protease
MRSRTRRSRLVLACGIWVFSLSLAVSTGFAQNPNWPVEGPPRPLAARDVRFPPYEVRALDNGLQVMTVLHHEQPAVTMHLLVRAGAAQDPDTKDGVAVLAAQLLDQGTSTKTAGEIADQIDSIGGSMGTGSGRDRTTASAVVMKDSFSLAMGLLADVVRNPAFAPEEIERQKEQMISSLRVNADDPDYVANVVFDRLVYGFHPYGLPGSGTPETIASITREDLRTFHRRYYVPNNMILAIVGDVTGEEAFAAAERVFGSWPRVEVPTQTPMEPPPPTRRVIVIDKPDSVQTEIRVGQLAIPRKHPDYLAWDLAVKILGGEGANRLHRVLRSERGLTYGASAETEAMKQAGDFVAETDTRTDTTGEALRLMVAEMEKILRQPVSPRELGDAQAYLAGSFPLTIETPNDIAVQVLNAMFYELPLHEISTFRERVQSITPGDIQRVAQRYIRPERLSIVLVGNAQAFLPQLRAMGYNEFEVIPLPELDLTSATFRRGRASIAERPTPVAAVAGAPANDARTQPEQATQATQATQVTQATQPAQAAGFVRVSAQSAAPRPQAPTRPNTPTSPVTPASPQSKPTAPRGENAAAELLRRVVEARGGLAALKAVRSVVAETDTVFMGEQGDVAATVKTKTYVLYPDKFRVDATIQSDVVSQIYNAGQAWEKHPKGVRDLPPQVRDEAAASVRRDAIPMLIAASEGQLSTRVLADVRGSDGRSLRVLEVSSTRFDPVRLYIDDQMLIAKQAFSTLGPDGRPVASEESFSDYRLVSGVRVPFQASVSRDGHTLIKRTLTKVTLNEPLPAGLFDRPQ